MHTVNSTWIFTITTPTAILGRRVAERHQPPATIAVVDGGKSGRLHTVNPT
jgi:hypothetical protein